MQRPAVSIAKARRKMLLVTAVSSADTIMGGARLSVTAVAATVAASWTASSSTPQTTGTPPPVRLFHASRPQATMRPCTCGHGVDPYLDGWFLLARHGFCRQMWIRRTPSLHCAPMPGHDSSARAGAGAGADGARARGARGRGARVHGALLLCHAWVLATRVFESV